MTIVDGRLLVSFPRIPRPTTVFQLISLSGFWILAALCHQLKPSPPVIEPRNNDKDVSHVLLLDTNNTSEKAITTLPLIMTNETEDSSLASPSSSSSSSSSPMLTLVFDSTEELQTRLVLLPRIEEEGTGAVVEQLTEQDDQDVCGTVVDAILTKEDDKIHLRDLEFAEILATLRSATPPIRLQLSRKVAAENDDEPENATATTTTEADKVTSEEQQPQEKAVVETKDTPKMEESSSREPMFEEEKKVDPADIVALRADIQDHLPTEKSSEPNNNGEDSNAPSMQQSLMSWASRFSSTSVQMATEKAQQAMEVAAERRKAAAAVMANSMSPRPKPTTSQDHNTTPTLLDVDLFIQTSSGAFLPVPKEKQRLSSELRVTNASLLTVRKSAAEACEPSSYSFQWYRSVEHANDCQGNATAWTELPGATSRTFQPTAVEVGHQIRCVVTKLAGDESDDDEDHDEGAVPTGETQSACLGTFEGVAAAMALFNGSRQALVKGAQFGGITGLGNAQGRSFRIKVSMKISKDVETKKTSSTCSLCIYQVSGTTSEPMHPEEEPITNVKATADHESAKGFELILPEHMPESASMVAALATDGKLQLSAPNRLGRESLLLSIGIANFTGEPSALGPTSVLFPDAETTVVDDTTALNDESESDKTVEQSETGSQAEPAHVPCPVPDTNDKLQRTASMDRSSYINEADAQKIKNLEKELSMLRSKMSKKDKNVTDLQRQVKSAESTSAKLRADLSKKDSEMKDVKRSLLVAERRMQSQEDDMKRIRSDHTKAVDALNKELGSRAATITEMEKTVRILQNEKAVLTATVEARDSKLAKMTGLRQSLEEAKAEASKTDDLRNQLQQASEKYDALAEEVKSAGEREKLLLADRDAARQKTSSLEQKAKKESEKANSCRAELATQQMKIQKLKAERNNYKQKSDSLSKEISRVCRHGRTIKDVEKIISDDAARRQEVVLLREQKRKALEDLSHYRTSFEQSRTAQRLAGTDNEATKVLERNVELERLLSELTEYVSAKEMQLNTLKAVNEALQAEITDLHKAMMSKNLGKNDV